MFVCACGLCVPCSALLRSTIPGFSMFRIAPEPCTPFNIFHTQREFCVRSCRESGVQGQGRLLSRGQGASYHCGICCPQAGRQMEPLKHQRKAKPSQPQEKLEVGMALEVAEAKVSDRLAVSYLRILFPKLFLTRRPTFVFFSFGFDLFWYGLAWF